MLNSFFTKFAPLVALALTGAGLLHADSASSTTFTGSITLTGNQYDDYFVYNADAGALQGTKGVGVTNPFSGQAYYVPAGTFPISESISSYITSGVATAIGLYSPTGVSVAVNQTLYNSIVGVASWDQVFTGTSESSIAAALASGDQATLSAFLNKYSGDFISFSSNTATPTTAGILHFSNAAPGGSITFASITAVGTPPDPTPTPTPTPTATPEPSTQLLFGSGFTLVALFARKLRKA